MPSLTTQAGWTTAMRSPLPAARDPSLDLTFAGVAYRRVIDGVGAGALGVCGQAADKTGCKARASPCQTACYPPVSVAWSVRSLAPSAHNQISLF